MTENLISSHKQLYGNVDLNKALKTVEPETVTASEHLLQQISTFQRLDASNSSQKKNLQVKHPYLQKLENSWERFKGYKNKFEPVRVQNYDFQQQKNKILASQQNLPKETENSLDKQSLENPDSLARDLNSEDEGYTTNNIKFQQQDLMNI